MADRAYTVEQQLQVRGLVAGQLTDMLEVHYAGPNGITGWVRVPLRTATEESVDATIRQQLDKQLAIAALGGL